MPSITRKAKTSFTRNKSLKKNKSPSISILKERSIQLQKGEPSILNKFTTKNVTVRDKNQNVWNTVENNKLAYKRSPRGAPIGTYPKPPTKVVESECCAFSFAACAYSKNP